MAINSRAVHSVAAHFPIAGVGAALFTFRSGRPPNLCRWATHLFLEIFQLLVRLQAAVDGQNFRQIGDATLLVGRREFVALFAPCRGGLLYAQRVLQDLGKSAFHVAIVRVDRIEHVANE